MLSNGLKKKKKPVMLVNAHLLSSSIEETRHFAQQIAGGLTRGSLITLKGDLGAGKTTFAKALISSLIDIDEDMISSPTFTYLNIYENPKLAIYHFDLYRLESEQGFIEKGFTDFLQSSGICIIEWPERIDSLLPPHYLEIELTTVDANVRKIVTTSL